MITNSSPIKNPGTNGPNWKNLFSRSPKKNSKGTHALKQMWELEKNIPDINGDKI